MHVDSWELIDKLATSADVHELSHNHLIHGENGLHGIYEELYSPSIVVLLNESGFEVLIDLFPVYGGLLVYDHFFIIAI